MLKQRLITAFTLGPLVMWGVLAMPNLAFAIALAVLILLGCWEWASLAGLETKPTRVIFTAVNAVFMLALWHFLHTIAQLGLPLFTLALVLWLVVFLLVLTYPKTVSLWASKWIKILAGILVLCLTWAALIVLHGSETDGPYLVLYLFLLIWFADSAAYFGGKRWGKHKLAPKVSPGKTWEGVVSSLGIAVLTALGGAFVLDLVAYGWQLSLAFFLLSLVVAFISVLGDLTESMFKREMSLKDSGSLLPGHGGILDRIDSMTVAAPFFLMGLWWLLDIELVLSGAK